MPTSASLGAKEEHWKVYAVPWGLIFAFPFPKFLIVFMQFVCYMQILHTRYWQINKTICEVHTGGWSKCPVKKKFSLVPYFFARKQTLCPGCNAATSNWASRSAQYHASKVRVNLLACYLVAVKERRKRMNLSFPTSPQNLQCSAPASRTILSCKNTWRQTVSVTRQSCYIPLKAKSGPIRKPPVVWTAVVCMSVFTGVRVVYDQRAPRLH